MRNIRVRPSELKTGDVFRVGRVVSEPTVRDNRGYIYLTIDLYGEDEAGNEIGGYIELCSFNHDEPICDVVRG